MSNKETAEKVLMYVGGAENVTNVYHCATRLRFTLKHSDEVQKEKLQETDGVINVLGNGTQIQVVIGNAVNKVFDELVPMLPFMENISSEAGEKGRLVDRAFNVISGIFAPYLPLIMCSGILTGLLSLASSMKWMNAESGTYAILSAAGNAVFYFFPVLLAITAAKQFKTNPYIAVVIGGVLLHPAFTALAEVKGAVEFFGIPVVMANYSSSVIPAILGVWFYSVIDHKLTKILPDSVRSLVITLSGLLIVVPLTILTFGPFGTYVSQMLGDGLSALVGFNPLIAGLIAGGLCGYMAIFGLQWGIIPIIIINITNKGFDYFTPMWLMATYSQIGLALGVLLKTKNSELKQLSFTSFLTGLFTGITEPIIYGLLTKFKKLHIPFITAGAVAGAFVGVMGVRQYTFVFAGILNFPGFFGKTFPFYIVGMILAIGIAAAMTYVIGFEESSRKTEVIENKPCEAILNSPVNGEIINLSDVKDKAFSSGSLGEGIAVLPADGKLYAPVSGTVTAVYPTGHAYGIMADSGAEILIHFGIDTVELNGEGFKTKVQQGQAVKKGDLMGEADLTSLAQKCYDTTVMMVVANSDYFHIKRLTNMKKVTNQTEVLRIS
ncbi:beta-glucoside-specific PTS transporter subunit IIABC [Anaerostipes sp.]|uniref:beta-glucoside-specific PTS transporter subunit IIABC n=1 Tax=Anaerostipes sp. TaxID=1872530 RepID=UPI0025C50C17|nr:beta-glucoside-specific PTS transporter subunit IIABC [Anaerostipes sp.]MBS7009433.1 beta-glucoside-specific PTS transporter subunit IIABC [Anaerostipes sp.]